jgi:hypothetical protein
MGVIMTSDAVKIRYVARISRSPNGCDDFKLRAPEVHPNWLNRARACMAVVAEYVMAVARAATASQPCLRHRSANRRRM